jgi:hypothetical protein
MPKKDLSGGFTKAAQQQRFVRHRDVKLKDSEVRKEERIQRVMCEGVCRRCRDKLQWRFQYDKYKPLKNIATCQNCKQKCVVKAYRAYCDPCGKKKAVCPGCCTSLEELSKLDEVYQATAVKGETAVVDETKAMDVDDEAEGSGADGKDDDDNDEGDEQQGQEEGGDVKAVEREPGWVENTDMDGGYFKLATMKYSKARVVGSEEDNELARKVSHYT